MSNQQVGAVFAKVIQEVCDSSQLDFEESGVDQQTLHDLQQTWQKKLSSVNVAHFPWDPAPVQHTQNPIHSPATVPSNAPRPHQQPQYIPPPASIPQHVHGQIPASMSMGAPRIKTEAGPIGHLPMPQMPLHDMNQSARDRAAAALKEKYGEAAASTVRQMQGQTSLPPNSLGQIPHIKQEHGYPSIGGQTDGGDDSLAGWKAEVARRRTAAESGEGDQILHRLRHHVNQRMNQYEAGGVMLPVSEHTSLDQGIEAAPAHPIMVGQLDGADGDVKEEDEDAINSDLDDPDDLLTNDNEGDETEGQIMLCTYEKVQRVKNKWKCTLKDGILTSGGKEYVFHKGSGEFEW